MGDPGLRNSSSNDALRGRIKWLRSWLGYFGYKQKEIERIVVQEEKEWNEQFGRN